MEIQTTFKSEEYDKLLVFCYSNMSINFHRVGFEVKNNRKYGKILLGVWRIKPC